MSARSVAAALLALIVAGAGCDTPAPETPGDPPIITETEPHYDYVFDPYSQVQYATNPMPFPPLKADDNDDIRWARPERYAITVPPANIEDVRPMVEWEPMMAMVMQWPTVYALGEANATWTMTNVAKHTATVADVWIFTDAQGEGYIIPKLLDVGMSQEEIDTKVHFLPSPGSFNSIWFIDYGPMPIVDMANDSFALADFRYYHPRPYDDAIPTVLGRLLPEAGQARPAVTYRVPITTEGGTFQATTDGICFTGGRQLYYMSCASKGGCDDSVRFAPLAELQEHELTHELEAVFGEYVGCKDVVITHSITDDGTGHIDMYMKVIDDNNILVGYYPEPYEADTPQEQNALRMDQNADFLASYVKADGSKFTIHRLVMPGHRPTNQGKMPFTYINSTFINGLNLWPATEYPEWNASRDLAQAEWEAAMPEYAHIYIDSTDLSFWSGAIHCITRTIPDKQPGLWVEDGTCVADDCEAPEGGYDGECRPHDVKEAVCWGPQWLCDCNNCATGCSYEPSGPVDQPCPPGLGKTGCCDGDTLVWCENSFALESEECPNGCGWTDAAGFYDCADGPSGAVAGAEEPTGAKPRACGFWCMPKCDGRDCGADGCGGLCGKCEEGQLCGEEGVCYWDCDHECAEGESGCDGTNAWTCAADGHGCLTRYASDCADQGLVCISGACFEAPDEPDPGPESSDDDVAGTSDLGGVEPIPPKGDDKGCAAGPNGSSPTPWLMLVCLGWMVAVAAIGRRRRHSARLRRAGMLRPGARSRG